MVTETRTTFGALLRRHRLAAGLTQEQLAERAGLSVYGIQKLERGATHPYRDTAARLTEALELTPDDADRFRAAVEPVRRRGTPQRDGRTNEHPTERRDNLPLALTSFVGRDHELASIPARVRAARLVALTGVGGSGKTRLAIELARRMSDQYVDGVWLVELAQVTDPALVPHRLAAALHVERTADRPLEQVLADALRDSQMLVLLDNCEHVLDACAVLVDFLLRECQGLQVLATSREPIGITGEVTWAVAPLQAPDPQLPGSVDEVQRSPAVRLFVDRASAALPSFVLGPENAAAVAQICRRLDGMPLALELAAARLDALTPAELASRLDQRFGVLTGGNRAALPRQQTLAATIDWSYVLLSETQRRVFERLSVFANGWSLEAAEAVCAGDGIVAADVLDAVLQFVRKHLVVRMDGSHGNARYGLLETLREYARNKLRERGDEGVATRERHAAYYSALAARLGPAGVRSPLPSSAKALAPPVFDIDVATLEDAHDNVHLALRWWLETRRVAEGLELIRALGALGWWVGWSVEGQPTIEAMLDLAASPTHAPAVPSAQHAQALIFASNAARLQGDHARAHTLIEASVAMSRTLDDPVSLAMALANWSADHLIRGELEQADAIAEEAVALARSVAEPFGLCMGLATLATAALVRGQHDRAVALLHESIAVGQTVGSAGQRALAVIRSLVWLGRVESERGESDTAIAVFKDALAQMRDSGVAGYLLAFNLAWMADAIGCTGEPVHAARLFGAAEAQLRRAAMKPNPTMKLSPRSGRAAAQTRLGREEFDRAWREGYAMDPARVFAYALDEPA
jgi:predicted ATPase/transcriptional regulator with XRE-family HTH domain